MRFKIQMAESAIERLHEFAEPNAVIVELLQAIECDLGDLEQLDGIKAVAPIRFQTHRVCSHCPRTKTRRRFLLWVDDCYSTEGTRIVIDIASAATGDVGPVASPFSAMAGERNGEVSAEFEIPNPR